MKSLLKEFSDELHGVLGNYGFPPHGMILFAGDLLQGENVLKSPDRRVVYEGDEGKIWLLDRQITGQDWLKPPFERSTNNPRVAFFGVKGGVGRSTALVVWAWRLAKNGKRILVFDLDLESPGVSSTLLPIQNLPDFGIVDWFVEDGVGQGDLVETDIAAISPLAAELPGEVFVVPAFGRKTEDYLSKLGRCYSESSDGENVGWSTRLEKFVAGMEAAKKPDIVILDSRAGIHDIAAAAITRMDADTFLFSVDSSQTWRAYSYLFRDWKYDPRLVEIRHRLQIVASMVPETGRDAYLDRFAVHAWDLFRENLYDYSAPDETEAFTFDLNDDTAPHYPWPVYWHRALQEFDPAGSKNVWDIKTAEEALGEFMDRVDRFMESRVGD